LICCRITEVVKYRVDISCAIFTYAGNGAFFDRTVSRQRSVIPRVDREKHRLAPITSLGDMVGQVRHNNARDPGRACASFRRFARWLRS
jgi:hypothetical protein